MSEKKPQAAKAKTQSKGQRQSGGRVPHLDTNSILHSIINSTQARITGPMRRAAALVKRAARHSL